MAKNAKGKKPSGPAYQRQSVASVKASSSRPAARPDAAGSGSPVLTQYKLGVTLLEDLHSGTGHTAGDLDGVQLKDRTGDPMISRGHLKGLLREIADELVALGHATAEEVENLFGAPFADGRGALSVTSLYLGDDPMTRVEWTSTARKPDERGPQGDTLRTVEYVGAGAVFHGLVEMMTAPGQSRARDLLELCCKRLVALGSGRTVGDGRIQTALGVLTVAPRPFAVPFAPKLRSTQPPATGKLRLRLVIRTLDAATFPATGDPGNLIFGSGFMGGSAHRGAWINALAELGHDAGWLLEERGPAFLDALPLPPDVLTTSQEIAAIEVMPIPLDHTTRKPPAQARDDWPWWGEPGPAGPGDDRKSKRPGEMEFLCRTSPASPWTRYAPEIRIQLRNNTGDRKRRNLADQSLFSVEGIVERTDFLTEVMFSDLAAAQKFMTAAKSLLDGRKWLKLGRGGAPAVVIGHLWLAPETASPLPVSQNQMSLVLTSDLILRGPRLGFMSRLSKDDVLSLAGLDAVNGAALGQVALAATMDTTLVHGFNASSGLPRQPALAIRRGSIFTLNASSAALALIWHGLATHLSIGLGARREEGHGRFRLEGTGIIDSVPFASQVSSSTAIDRRERAVAEGVDLAARLSGRGSFASRPSKGQLEQLRRGIQRSATLQDLETQITLCEQHAETVGGEAWKAFNFAELDRGRSEFGTTLASWKVVVDTALRTLVRAAKPGSGGDQS